MALFSNNHANSLNHKWQSIRRRPAILDPIYRANSSKSKLTGIVAKDVKIIPGADIAGLCFNGRRVTKL